MNLVLLKGRDVVTCFHLPNINTTRVSRSVPTTLSQAQIKSSTLSARSSPILRLKTQSNNPTDTSLSSLSSGLYFSWSLRSMSYSASPGNPSKGFSYKHTLENLLLLHLLHPHLIKIMLFVLPIRVDCKLKFFFSSFWQFCLTSWESWEDAVGGDQE